MKKISFNVILCGMILLTAFFGACRKSPGSSPASVNTGLPTEGKTTVRLLTDATGIDDKSFNAAAWRGILEFYGDTWENARQCEPVLTVHESSF